MPEPKRPLKVFLCHAHADRDSVRGLYARLTNDGVDAWLDKEKLLPGQDWELEIRKAVREADVVVVCLSKQFNQAGFRQKEVRLALDTAMEKPEGEIFIIPARLEECDNLESLRKWQWVNLFEDDGYEMLMRALRSRANKIGATLQTKKSWLPIGNTQPAVVKKPLPPVEKPKKEIQISKNFNRSIIGVIGFVVLVLASIFGLPSLIGKPKPTPIAINTYRLETVTSTFENNIPSATFTPTVSYTSTNTPFLTATFQPRTINWDDTHVNLSGEPISLANVKHLKTIANMYISSGGSHTAPDLVISPDEKLIIYNLGNIIYIRKIENGSIVKTLTHPHTVGCFAISPDGKLLASVDGNMGVSFVKFKIWSMDDGSLLQELNNQQPEISCPIAFSPDGSLLISGPQYDSKRDSESINVWRVSDWKLVKSLNDQNDSTSDVFNSIFSPDGSLLAGNVYDSNQKTYITYMWNVNDWTLAHLFQNSGYALAFSSDNNLFATIRDGTVSIWKVEDGSLVQELKDSSSPKLAIKEPVFFLPNNQILVTGWYEEGRSIHMGFRLWRVSDGALIYDVILGDHFSSGTVSGDGAALYFVFEIYNFTVIRSFGIIP